MQKATIRKSRTLLRNTPYLTTGSLLNLIERLEKLAPLNSMPIGGIITSLTNDVTILPKAPPMMMPTAISTALPFRANSRNSLSMPITVLPHWSAKWSKASE